MFSGYIKDLEAKPAATCWGARMPFSALMSELSNSEAGGGWVHALAFSPAGDTLAWVAHDSSVTVASPQ